MYNREFKSDDEVNISAEDKDVDVTIATDDRDKDFSFCLIRFLTDVTNALRVSIVIIIHHHSSSSDKKNVTKQTYTEYLLKNPVKGGVWLDLTKTIVIKKILLRREYGWT